MKLRYFLLYTLLISLHLSGYSQRHCGTEQIHQQHQEKNDALYKSQEDFKDRLNLILQHPRPLRTAEEPIYTIPVVVHVIYNSLSATNISDAQVLSQIDVLNEDFRKKTGTNGFNSNPIGADTKIEFCLASRDPDGNATNGINRIFDARTNWTADLSDELLIKSFVHWPGDKYLNIYVCQMESDYLGYAQYPDDYNLPGPKITNDDLDGVVIDYKAFGRTGVAGTSPRGLYGLGRTTTHEVSHWLGLVHIWGEFSGCGTDYVSDTPIDAGSNMDANCNDQSDCDGDGTSVPDMTNNYLDYSPDMCMNLFTNGQKDRMRAVIESSPRRLALLTSNGCQVPLAIDPKKISATESLEKLLEGNEDVFCEIYDITGRKIYEERLYGNSKILPTSLLPSGFYILKASTINSSVTQKFYINK